MPTLKAREVYQQLRDAALGLRPLRRLNPQQVDIEGWHLSLDFDGLHLHHCTHCQTPDGRQWSLEASQRFGTDPVSLLSTWELVQVERLLAQG